MLSIDVRVRLPSVPTGIVGIRVFLPDHFNWTEFSDVDARFILSLLQALHDYGKLVPAAPAKEGAT